MKFELSDRVQYESYCCAVHFMQDVIETLFDEDLDVESVQIVSDKYTTELLLKTICQIEIEDFEFDLTVIDYDKIDDSVDEYRIGICDDGEVFIEPAIDKNADYYDCDGFIFAESDVSSDLYSGNNRHCDVMVFSIDE